MSWIGKDFQLGQWTKICSLHFEPKDFYNFWSQYRTLREDAVPSIFPFEPVTAVKTKQGRVSRGEVGHHNPDAEATDSESDSSEGMRVQCTSSEAAGSGIQQDDVYEVCTDCNQHVQVQYLKREVTEANEEIRKLKEQLEETQKHVKEAQDTVTKLNQCLNEARAESTKYQQLAEKQKFCFSNIEKSDKHVHFYTG